MAANGHDGDASADRPTSRNAQVRLATPYEQPSSTRQFGYQSRGANMANACSCRLHAMSGVISYALDVRDASFTSCACLMRGDLQSGTTHSL